MIADSHAVRIPAPLPSGRQPSFTAHVDFDLPDRVDTERLASWLAWMADIPASPIPTIGPAPDLWADHALHCAQLLFHSISVPILDRPQLLRCEPLAMDSAARWRAHFRLAAIEFVDTQLYQTVISVAFALLPWLNGHEQSRTNRAALDRTVVERVIQFGSKRIAAGKSTLPVLRIAHGLGIPFQAVGRGIYRLGWGSRARYLDRSATSGDGLPGWRLCADKMLSARLLRHAGLPAPTHERVESDASVHAAGDRLGWPLVVKPVDGERGEGVNVDVSPDAVTDAFAKACAASPTGRVLAERQVAGTCHRLFIAWGRLLYAVKRLPVGVYGDGHTSLAALVESAAEAQAQKPSWLRSPFPGIDALALESLRASAVTPQSIPANGQFVALRRLESTAEGGVDEDVSHSVHPDNLQAALSAVALLGLDVAGVDFISQDIAQPWHANGAIINEINGAPLLGGGTISRTHVPEFLQRLLGGDGRIPIEVHVGSRSAWAAARRRALALRQAGYRTFLTSATETLDDDGHPVPMMGHGLEVRARALTLRTAVDAMLLIVDSDELLHSAGAIEGIDRFSVEDRTLLDHRDPTRQLTDDEFSAVLARLEQWCWPRQSSAVDQNADPTEGLEQRIRHAAL
jgi:cyanophycin synthetase